MSTHEDATRSVVKHPPAPGSWWSRTIGGVREWLEMSGSQPEMEFERANFEDVEAQLWGLSPERRWYMKRRPKVFAGALSGFALLIAAALVGQPPRTDIEEWWGVLLAGLGIASLVYSTFPYWAARLAFNERRRKMAGYVASDTLRDIRSGNDIALPLLFSYNRRQLDAYQEEARNQQRLAFRYALLTSVLGFVVLLVGIAASLRVGPGTEAYVAAGLSGMGAALSAYVAGTMLRISRRADTQLNRFYTEPHMMGRLLLAERLMQSADAAGRNDERAAIIKQVLAWPLPGANGQQDDEAKD
jgi:hypothetical protein